MRGTRPRYLVLLFVGATMLAGCGNGEPLPLPEMPAGGEPLPLPDVREREFDFWLGEWNVQNKHLRRGGWVDSGKARALIQPVVDGAAVLEQWTGALGDNPLIGFSIRAFDPGLGKWMIYLNWHGGQPGGFSPMHGTRNGERIELFPPDDDQHMRYTFSQAREGSCQWDKAQSKDGRDWKTDWIMRFTRAEAPTVADASSFPVALPPESAWKFPETRKLDFLLGNWTGKTTAPNADGSVREGTALATISSMIEGLALLQFIDTDDGHRSFAALGHDTGAESWVAIQATSDRAGLLRMVGKPGEAQVSFTGETADGMLRETWSDCSGDHCNWERAHSPDGGKTWTPLLTIAWTRTEKGDVYQTGVSGTP